jgi:hypothetical protein
MCLPLVSREGGEGGREEGEVEGGRKKERRTREGIAAKRTPRGGGRERREGPR